MYFFAILSTLFFIGSTVAEFEAFFKEHGYDVNNLEPFWLAQELMVAGPLLPDRHLFEKIDKELKAIRASNPHLVDVHHQPMFVPGRISLQNYDLKALNHSIYAPIDVVYHSSTSYMVIFKRPYYVYSRTGPFDQILNGFRIRDAVVTSIGGVPNLPRYGYIKRVPNYKESTISYTFVQYIDPCDNRYNCENNRKNEWEVVIKDQ